MTFISDTLKKYQQLLEIVQHFSNTANYGFLDLFFCLSIAKGISMGAANVLEMFDPAGQVGVDLQPNTI